MKVKRGLLAVMTILVMTSLFVIQAFAASTPPKPKMFIWGTHEAGSSAYVLASLVGETVNEKLGITVRSIPSASYVGRAYSARLGDTHVMQDDSVNMVFMQEGLLEYSTLDWGPQPVRYLYLPQHVGHCLAVRADSTIYEGKQLKGKRIARIPASPGYDQTMMAMLAFHGLYEKDIVSVNFPSPAAGWDAQIEGKVDSGFWNVVAPKTYELDANRGIRWLPMPANDREGWARAQKVAPVASKKITIGVRISEDKPLEGQTRAYPCIVSWENLNSDIAYWTTKALWELYDAYKTKHETFKIDWKHETHWHLWDSDVVPMHEGAILYFKDIGQWNDKREKMQQERLKHQSDLKKLWDKVKKDATQKKIGKADFSKYWMDQRKAAGF